MVTVTRMVSVEWWEQKLDWHGFKRETEVKRLEIFAVKGSIK